MRNRKPALAIIGGTGALGHGLAARWLRAGFDVVIGSRSKEKALETARTLGQALNLSPPRAEENLAAAEAADIVVLTVPFSHHTETLKAIQPGLADKILVDTTVPLVPPNVGTVLLPKGGSAGMIAQDLLGDSVRVVSAFQNVAAHHLQSEGAIDCDVLVAGNDEKAREAIIGLAAAIGLRAWHAGSIENSIAAEALTSVLIQINKANRCRAGIRISGVVSEEHEYGLELFALPGIPLVREGDNLVDLIDQSLLKAGKVLRDGDVIVLAQKIVSKSEGRMCDLARVSPSAEAQELAGTTGQDPRFVELALSQSDEIVKAAPNVLITAHRLGFIYANAGVDHSNVDARDGAARYLLLPEDPDASAAQLSATLSKRYGAHVAVIINDSSGRPWRNGLTSIAIGASGLEVLRDMRGKRDLYARPLENTQIACADEIASAASILMGQADEARPVILVRGVAATDVHQDASHLIRPKTEDLFR